MSEAAGFSAEWLDLREPCDRAARSAALKGALAARLADAEGSGPVTLVDLGAGTGALLRDLAPLVRRAQDWRLVERDPALVRAGAARLATWATERGWQARETEEAGLEISRPDGAIRIRWERRDLSRGLGFLADPGVDAILASALVDLVSAEWADELAGTVAGGRAHLLLCLEVDGTVRFDPPLDDDPEVHAAFARHQRTDKGFGPALGPAAASHVAARLMAMGRRVELRESPWRLGPGERAVQVALVEGMARAAGETAPARAAAFADWAAARRRLAEAGRSTMVVGHLDLLSVGP